MSYNDDTRELRLTVPDGKKVTFVFAVNAIESGTHTYTNSVVLNAEVHDEDTTEREYVIKKSEAGIQGVDLYVSLKKIDRNNPLKGLPGAKFKLVHVKTPGIPRNENGKAQNVTTYVDDQGETQYVAQGDGTFGDEEPVGIYETVGESGGLNFTNIEPYEVYYWVETDPAPGYIMTNTERHYFVAYPIVRNNTAATTENQHNVWAIDNTVSSANNVTIVSARSGYSWNVTNLKEESVKGHFEGVKTLQGRDMEADEFIFSLEAVSANVMEIVDETEQAVDLTPAEMPMPAETTVKNPAGTENTEVGFTFGDIEFTKTGTYRYKIKETAGEDTTISYDSTEYFANVLIERDSETGDLKDPVITYTKVDGTSVEKPDFKNELKRGSLDITKNIQKNGTIDTSKTGTFYFAVYKEQYDPDNPTDPVKTGSITVTENGTKTETVTDLLYGTYYVYELTEEGGEPIISDTAGVRKVINSTTYTVTGSGTTATVAETNGTATLNNNIEVTDFEVTKIWKDNSDQNVAWVKDIEIKLHKKSGSTETIYTYTVKEESSQTGGEAYSATSSQADAPNAVVTGDAQAGYKIKWSDLEIGFEYSATEERLDGYKAPIYAIKGTDSGGFINTESGSQLTNATNGRYIINKPLDAVTLPSTGGPGTRFYYSLGIAFIAMAGIILFIKRKEMRSLRGEVVIPGDED